LIVDLIPPFGGGLNTEGLGITASLVVYLY
jgi:hypothetical protein